MYIPCMADSTFASLGLRDSLVRTLTTLGYEAPTPIQERTIPLLLGQKNVIGQAQTGTGKTAAFALPILEKVDPERRETQALVLTPTRELAMQVAEALHSYAHDMPQLSVLPVYGGAPIGHQLSRLQRGAQIVVGTPGRLIDHLDRRSLSLKDIRMIVLDEADEMLKMGFKDDVDRILAELPKTRQIALFSATMPPEVLRIAERHMPGAERVAIEQKTMTASAIEQRFINVSEAQKLDVLTKMLELEENEAVLIFRRTKTGSAELAERLAGRGFAAEAMHGDMNQRERESVIRRLKAGQIEIVVATDVAARGLDVEQISHVVNFDIPWDVEAYVHRIGRTGRAGRSGVATLFVTPRERKQMREIEKFTRTAIKPMKMPTTADLAAARVAALKESLRKVIADGDLDLYLEVVEQLVDEGQHDVAEIAAAAVKVASGSRPIAAEREEPMAVTPERTAKPARASKGGDRVRLSISLGKRDGIRPADVVGSIANEAGLSGSEIGPIEIRDTMTFVEVPAESADVVIAKVGRTRFRGKNVKLQRAGGDDRPVRGRKTVPPKTKEHGRKRFERR
jgi:ATP-dependent RNA helicase DeaD